MRFRVKGTYVHACQEHYGAFNAPKTVEDLRELVELFANLANSMRGKYESSAAVIATTVS